MSTGKRVLIISNRLPIKITYQDGAMTYASSEGGLATGLGSIYKENDNLWIGWPGAMLKESEEAQVTEDMARQNLRPVFLTQEEINDYYEGFSNETLWPLFHYFPTYATYHPHQYDAYYRVNQKFADAVISVATNDDIIWIHDYQLLLLPEMIRNVLPEVTIGFFGHIPFPSFEVFRLLPWREPLLRGMLGADVIGFHTYDDVRHFISAVNRIVNIHGEANQLTVSSRTVVVDAFPISIDYEKYHSQAEHGNTKQLEHKLYPVIHPGKLMLSIDRLDYSKGIIHRLQAYEVFLERHPEMHGKTSLLQLVVPSRDTVPMYRELKREINRYVSDINGQYGRLDWQPIQHFYRSFPFPLLSALYKMADVALVTPLRDGMNLVSKEYVASKVDGKGVLVLSEMAGAARELSEAIIVNPNDIWGMADAIYQALTMPEEEQKRRMAGMQQTVSRFDIHNWVRNFMTKLEETKASQQEMYTRIISPSMLQKMALRYHYGLKRLLILDYDGTLIPFPSHITAAVPDEPLLNLLHELTDDPNNKVVITSGRDYQTLEDWLGGLPVDIIADHGAWYKEHSKLWRSRRDLNNDWKDEIRSMMEVFNSRTPGAAIEEKSYSLAWHYRNAETGLGQLRANELMADISHFVTSRGLQLLQGDKVIEVKSMAVNKGKAVRRWLERDSYDFIIAIGDNYTDEDTFRAMPEDAITIKVGNHISAASYYLNSFKEVRALLQEFCNAAAYNPVEDSLREAS